jgi:hypothetical protein
VPHSLCFEAMFDHDRLSLMHPIWIIAATHHLSSQRVCSFFGLPTGDYDTGIRVTSRILPAMDVKYVVWTTRLCRELNNGLMRTVKAR